MENMSRICHARPIFVDVDVNSRWEPSIVRLPLFINVMENNFLNILTPSMTKFYFGYEPACEQGPYQMTLSNWRHMFKGIRLS